MSAWIGTGCWGGAEGWTERERADDRDAVTGTGWGRVVRRQRRGAAPGRHHGLDGRDRGPTAVRER